MELKPAVHEKWPISVKKRQRETRIIRVVGQERTTLN